MPFIFLIVLVAAIGTIMVGIKPKDQNYGTKTKRNLTRLTMFYVICTVIFLGIFFYFFYK
ncbi:hypothetical protein D5F52_06720 [Brevibacillus laterosporus]|uniref:Group-specific protein n=1 Tax=Brevibacillus laterosporus TaxID=1465 RepID=A0AAP8U5V1_BRELA|nr:hypothetical protein D5F52_06720 [Brevibacillus laterosporus]PPA87808.1 hypothetical protein C4A75_00850 [Brevibacillus laterosporus]PPB08302.1 hypothetical protein C4A77_08745 [Brevibacillus laterosporus]RFB34977.1 hypothetical protein DZB91_09990 [Brevibacillus sp. VP]TPH13198.1 hypothetical protein EGH09_15390 [Brevibacillus laterosporus]